MTVKTRGQSLVEFALILPLLLTLFGAAVDVARMFQAANVLESAARDAAEFAATNDTTSADAAADAARVLCTETASLPGYQAQAGAPGCSSPSLTIASYSLSTSAPGATSKNPIGSVTVTVTFPFKTLFPYPLFTQSGVWTLHSTQSYSIVQGR